MKQLKTTAKIHIMFALNLLRLSEKKITSRAKHLSDIFSKNMHHFLIEINWFLFLFICYTRSKKKQKNGEINGKEAKYVN